MCIADCQLDSHFLHAVNVTTTRTMLAKTRMIGTAMTDSVDTDHMGKEARRDVYKL